MKKGNLAAMAVILVSAGLAHGAPLDDLAQRLGSSETGVSSAALLEVTPPRPADRQALAVKLAAQFRLRSEEYLWADHVQNTNIAHALAELGSDATPTIPGLVAAIDYAACGPPDEDCQLNPQADLCDAIEPAPADD